MIHYRLICDGEHEFEGWFRNSADFENQAEGGYVTCPACGSGKVQRALMAPSVGGAGKSKGEPEQTPAPAQTLARPDPKAEKMVELMRAMRDHVTENSDYVGEKFPEEARKIHYGETEQRGIHGEASAEDVKELHEEGVEFYPLPVLPEDRN